MRRVGAEAVRTLFSRVLALDGFALFFKGLFLAGTLLGVLFGARSRRAACAATSRATGAWRRSGHGAAARTRTGKVRVSAGRVSGGSKERRYLNFNLVFPAASPTKTKRATPPPPTLPGGAVTV